MVSGIPRSEIVRVLDRFNPWWTGRAHPIPTFQRLALHVCRRYLLDESLRRGVMLIGPRRVGKSTILNQIAASLVKSGRDPKSVLYLSLDHPIVKLVQLGELLDVFHETFYPAGKPAVLLLDEVHYARDWDLQLKVWIDHHPEYRILATGSAAVRHRSEIADTGVGRWVTVPIPTLSFYEFLRIREEPTVDGLEDLRPSDLYRSSQADLVALAGRFRPLMPLFERYLLVGGFPETARQTDITLCQRLLREDIVERVLKRDMTTLFGVRQVADLERLFIYICYHTGRILNASACSNELGIVRQTVVSYLDLLEQANLVYRLQPDQIGGKKVLKAQHKYYLVDAALRNAVLLRGDEVLQNQEELGLIAETTVLRHLYAFHYPDAPRICYWNDPATGREVDIIVKSPSYTIPVEVKYRESPRIGGDDGLARYCRAEKVARAYLVTKRDADFGVLNIPNSTTQVLLIPAHIFTYLLGSTERRGLPA